MERISEYIIKLQMVLTRFWSSCIADETVLGSRDGNPAWWVYGTGGGLGTIFFALPVTRLWNMQVGTEIFKHKDNMFKCRSALYIGTYTIFWCS